MPREEQDNAGMSPEEGVGRRFLREGFPSLTRETGFWGGGGTDDVAHGGNSDDAGELPAIEHSNLPKLVKVNGGGSEDCCLGGREWHVVHFFRVDFFFPVLTLDVFSDRF